MLGLASETGSILNVYKKYLRDGIDLAANREFLREELGDLLWYVAAVATAFGLDLEEIAAANLQRTRDWYPTEHPPRQRDELPIFDAGYPPHERFPRRLVVSFAEHTLPSGRAAVALTLVSARVELFRHMFLHDALGKRLLEAKLFREVYELLHGYPLTGDFMSYQTAIDLNYSDLINFSENEFTRPGPGALRGIRKCFENLGNYTPTEVVMWMVEHQEREFARFGLSFNGLWGRPLHAIDCQGLFCETDKYCREAAPELASVRKRIKARFSVTSEPIQLFFPPKWKINDKLPKGAVLGESSIPINGAKNALLW